MSFKNYKREYLMKDIISGIIVALISIPISMGYSQVAGLPVVYGLYGSLFPVIVFGLISSSPQFVFGVDAAPAALVGGTIATLGIASGRSDAGCAGHNIRYCVLASAFLLSKGGKAC